MCDNENMLDLLRAILDCDRSCLERLRKVQRPWRTVLERMQYAGEKLDFNTLMTAVVVGVKDDIRHEIDDIVTDLKEKDAAQGLSDEEKEKLNALKTLDPYRDIQGHFDYLNAHFWFAHNGSIYQKYLSAAIDDFEYDVGLKIADDGAATEVK